MHSPSQSGRNEVSILGLSSTIDVDSARVTGLGDARLFEVSCKIQKPDSWDVLPDSATERVRALKAKKTTLAQEKYNAESVARLLLVDVLQRGYDAIEVKL